MGMELEVKKDQLAPATIDQKDVDELNVGLDDLVARSEAIVVEDEESANLAGVIMNDAHARLKKVEAYFRPITRKIDAGKDIVLGIRKGLDNPLDKVKASANQKIGVYLREQKVKAEAEAMRLAEAGRKEEEERQIAEAEDAEKSGDKERAEEIISELPAVHPVIQPSAPKVAGIGAGTVWKYRVINKYYVKPAYLIPAEPNEKAIKEAVDRLGKEAEITVGGIEVWNDIQVRAGRR